MFNYIFAVALFFSINLSAVNAVSTENAIKDIFADMQSHVNEDYKWCVDDNGRKYRKKSTNTKKFMKAREILEAMVQDKGMHTSCNVRSVLNVLNSDSTRGTYRAGDVFAIFTPKEIYEHSLLQTVTGCVGDARVFVYLMNQKYPKINVRYVMTVVEADYLKVCPVQNGTLPVGSNGHMNGHQVVAIKFSEDNKWKIIDSSEYEKISYAKWNDTNAEVSVRRIKKLLSTNKKSKIINFNKNPNNPYIISAILDADSIVNHKDAYRHDDLMKYYASGEKNSSVCKWVIGTSSTSTINSVPKKKKLNGWTLN